jgi:glycosyltransferase involved in cell wall biosynthesis
MAARPWISIIVATRNRRALLVKTLDALIDQEWPRDRFEIIVADNGSTDATPAAVAAAAGRENAPAVHYLFVAEPGKSHAVNRALLVARGNILAFTDDDVLPARTWLAALADALSRRGVDFVAGRILPIWEAPPPPWMSPALFGVLAVPDNGDRRLDIGPGSDNVVPVGANMAVRREVVDQVGGLRLDFGKLEGSLRSGEDHELFLRMLHAGYRGLYDPRAVVRHLVSRERLEPAYFRGWHYQNGRDVARLERTYPSSARRLFGIPRYLWRQAMTDAWTIGRATLYRDESVRFAAEVRLIWLRGYVRESWFGARRASDPSAGAAIGRVSTAR